MNCELAHERIVMAAYGELPDDAAHELDRHLVTCIGCQGEREQLRALKLLAEAYPVEEPVGESHCSLAAAARGGSGRAPS